MKIVQLFNREEIEANKFKEINDKHKKAWINLYNPFSFPLLILFPQALWSSGARKRTKTPDNFLSR
jgi:ABC-type transport system involved in Fe-S cluster assembly fused permease/ATPase subunit